MMVASGLDPSEIGDDLVNVLIGAVIMVRVVRQAIVAAVVMMLMPFVSLVAFVAFVMALMTFVMMAFMVMLPSATASLLQNSILSRALNASSDRLGALLLKGYHRGVVVLVDTPHSSLLRGTVHLSVSMGLSAGDNCISSENESASLHLDS
jgi:uncharacterized membrane protein